MLKQWMLVGLCAALMIALPVFAQDDGDLSVNAVEVVESMGVFGQPVQVVRGSLINNSATAYTNISLSAAAYNTGDTLIAEGFGVVVNACGAGLLFDFALQPGHAIHFEIPLEVFGQGRIDRVQVTPTADPTEAQPVIQLPDGITPVAVDQEAVAVEWIDDEHLRYGVGCGRDLFSTWDWFEYEIGDDAPVESEHPYAELVTPELAQTLRLEDAEIFNRSALTFAPDGDRLVYQDEINTLFTAGFEGQTRYLLYNLLANRSLQGIYWQPDERFLAYYYGAYGDPVYYFTADANSRYISPFLTDNPPSQIVPGVSRDARRVIVGGTFDEVTGYFLYVVTNNFFELLFEATPPGNNYPSPLMVANVEDNLIARVYVALDVEGVPHLQCFNRMDGELHDLAPLPFSLATDERAQWWMSPNERKIALAATGAQGGLWVIDLDALPPCGEE